MLSRAAEGPPVVSVLSLIPDPEFSVFSMIKRQLSERLHAHTCGCPACGGLSCLLYAPYLEHSLSFPIQLMHPAQYSPAGSLE